MNREQLLDCLSPDESRLMHRFWALPAELHTPTILDIAGRVERHGYFASAAQMGFFGARLREQELGQGARPERGEMVHEQEQGPTVVPPSSDDFPWR